MRSQGNVRFIKVTSRVQKLVAGGIVAALLVWAISMGVMSWLQYRAAADRISLLEREAQVATAAERVDAYRDDLGSVATDLERRQSFIEDMVAALPSDAKAGETVTVSGKGRHDPCVLPRAVPIVDNMVALVLADMALRARSSMIV